MEKFFKKIGEIFQTLEMLFKVLEKLFKCFYIKDFEWTGPIITETIYNVSKCIFDSFHDKSFVTGD